MIRYLENKFVEQARKCNRYKVLTKNTYRHTVMKPSQEVVMEEFSDNVKVVINALGYKVLEPVLQMKTEAFQAYDQKLYISIGNASAIGMVTTEGFVVQKGAIINEKTSYKSLGNSMTKLREKIITEGKVVEQVTQEDILFSSSSAAADFVLGYSVSGPATWKSETGKSLKEIERTAVE